MSNTKIGTNGESINDVYSEEETKAQVRTWFQTSRRNVVGQKIGFAPINRKTARSLQKHLMFSNQRSLRQSNLAVLIGAMKDKSFLNNNPIWICELPDGTYVIVNGQHTLEAIVQTNTTQELIVVLDPLTGDGAIEQRYASFDMGAARTQKDILRMQNIQLALDTDDYTTETFATQRQIMKSAEAVTWLSTGLISNISPLTKMQRGEAVRKTWKKEISRFWAVLGNPCDNELSDENQQAFNLFYKKIEGGTFQAPFLASLKAYPEETELVMQKLIEFAKSGGELDPDDHLIEGQKGISYLHDLIVAPNKEYYGGVRGNLVWRVSLYLQHCRDVSDGARKEEKRQFKVSDAAARLRNTWFYATGNRIPKPTYVKPVVDMVGAKARRRVINITENEDNDDEQLVA